MDQNNIKQKSKKSENFTVKWIKKYYRQNTAFVCVIILIFSYFLVISPKIQKSQELGRDRWNTEVEGRQELESRLNELLQLQDLRNNINQVNLDRLYGMLPNQPQTPVILASLESMATNNDTSVRSIDFLLPEEGVARPSSSLRSPTLGGDIKVVEIRISVNNTTYAAIKNFMTDLETSERLMDIKSLNYNPVGEAYTIVAHSYYQVL